MKKGSAAIWAEVCCQQGLATLLFGTFAQFQQDFDNTFVDTNAAREAMNWLSTTCINSGEQLQEYINMFKLNVVHAKYDETKDAATLISYFSAGVPTWIMHRIQAMDTVLYQPPLPSGTKKPPTFASRRRLLERLLSCITETPPNHPVLTRVLACRTSVPLVTQTPWISMH